MADEADIANAEQARLLELQLTVRRPEGPRATGRCLTCGQHPLPAGRRWCDAVCRDEWELLGGKR